MTPIRKSKQSSAFPHTNSNPAKHHHNHLRGNAVLVSFAYLFGPLLLAPLPDNSPPSVLLPSSVSSQSLLDSIPGMGGPEEVPMREVGPLKTLEVVFEDEDSRFDIFGMEEESSLVTITKTLNHLKVANTVMPTTAPEITSDYGWRTPPCRGCSSDHKGIDFVPGFGEPIFAVADGMVIDMGRNGGYGNFVKVKHLMANSEGVIEEWVSLYAHMKNESFPEGMIIGSAVKSGETIGAVGSTGMSTGAHLHFELTINGEHVDPLPLLGTYEVIIVSEEDYPDYMFVGETFKMVEYVVTYE